MDTVESHFATISHNKDLMYHLHESDFQRLRVIEEAVEALDRGQYGDCARCGEDINEKRLRALPWAALCIQCQLDTEKNGTSSDLVRAGLEEEMDL
jgi:DnaK suppressor protein